MNAKDLIEAGKLQEARKALIDEVKSSPGDVRTRGLLFQVLAFCGEWDRAERHLDVIGAQDQKAETGVQVYKNLLTAERERSEVSKHNRRPAFLPKAPPYAETYFFACEKLAEKKVEESIELFNRIDDQRPEISGTLNGKDFTGFKDTDTFLSLFLEAIVHERYIWIPFENIIEVVISPPKTLFDLLWTKALVTDREGLTLNCFLPVLYPDSFLHEDDRVKLGRMTDWISLGGPFSKGMGQHVFETDGDELSILEIREARFHFPETPISD
jgi:type VI secretion system protein ImpE